LVEALLAEMHSQYDAAARAFDDVERGWSDFGNPHERAHALFGKGRCLSALGDAEAGACLHAARALFESLGAAPSIREVDAALRR